MLLSIALICPISLNAMFSVGHSESTDSMLMMDSVLSPILNMAVSESKRPRVLVASCILYSEVNVCITWFTLISINSY